MKADIKNPNQLFICVLRESLTKPNKILCEGIDEMGYYYQAWHKDQIHEAYKIKYMAARTLEEATVRFFEYLRGVFDPLSGHYDKFQVEAQKGVIRTKGGYTVYKIYEASKGETKY